MLVGMINSKQSIQHRCFTNDDFDLIYSASDSYLDFSASYLAISASFFAVSTSIFSPFGKDYLPRDIKVYRCEIKIPRCKKPANISIVVIIIAELSTGN